ncbi:pseudouridine synthase [Undibacterium parvum]|uniref:Pseudouridine synthase n=1 Tax=Undibacterium parvum TaxID=401471 RepID=A0A3S9HLU7_9BURK|nr:pseudouridine synthase [Undibacterium parvum]AZP13074.1 pseudouridine synthase [Undibacterium parvum]
MQFKSPLPIRDGVAASYLWLPEGHWNNMLEFLLMQFPDVLEATWRQRMEKHELLDMHGNALQANSVAKRGMCIFYYRELEAETLIPFEERILHQDQHLLVVDKPHFLPVTPGGRFLHETLLVRLKKKLGLEHLTPIHRLDRETAGVILFSCEPSSRGNYQSLFQQRTIQKTYHALAPHLPELHFPLIHRSHMLESEQFFVMQEGLGVANSETAIDIIDRRGELSLYQLQPSTGKKHQLRVHLASLGAPIVNDSFYPVALPCKADDFSMPLKLLAKAIAFTDPISAKLRYFESQQSL